MCPAEGVERTRRSAGNSSFHQANEFKDLITISKYRQFLICMSYSFCQNFIYQANFWWHILYLVILGTVVPHYNEVLGIMKITLLYQGKKNK